MYLWTKPASVDAGTLTTVIADTGELFLIVKSQRIDEQPSYSEGLLDVPDRGGRGGSKLRAQVGNIDFFNFGPTDERMGAACLVSSQYVLRESDSFKLSCSLSYGKFSVLQIFV